MHSVAPSSDLRVNWSTLGSTVNLSIAESHECLIKICRYCADYKRPNKHTYFGYFKSFTDKSLTSSFKTWKTCDVAVISKRKCSRPYQGVIFKHHIEGCIPSSRDPSLL